MNVTQDRKRKGKLLLGKGRRSLITRLIRRLFCWFIGWLISGFVGWLGWWGFRLGGFNGSFWSWFGGLGRDRLGATHYSEDTHGYE